MKGKLYVVATPIGNLEDITLRALRILKEVDYVLCEDTRVTRKLLQHYEIGTKTVRYDAHSSLRVHNDIVSDLEHGKHVALVSDAGTPGISDPGVMLVNLVREAGVATIEVIPGPSALTAAYSIAGVKGNQFIFLGYAPQKKGRATFFSTLESYELPIIFYEAPHRIMKTLESLKDTLSDNHQVVIGRELTKMHEEIVKASAQEVLHYFEKNPDRVRGEFVVLVVPPNAQ